jgi:hypothetical protein
MTAYSSSTTRIMNDLLTHCEAALKGNVSGCSSTYPLMWGLWCGEVLLTVWRTGVSNCAAFTRRSLGADESHAQ